LAKKKKEYHVYVVGLKPSVLQETKCKKQNPDFKPAPNKRCYYVGYTGETPEIRYNKHITGHKTKKGYDTSSDVVKNHGYKKNGLRPRQYKKYNPISKEDEAKKIEKELAEKLRKKEHFVYQK
jgi:hypothetical protein